MLISLRSDHKDHLQLLTSQSEQVIADFCILASDFLHNGSNLKMYSTAAKKLQVDVDKIQNCIYGVINLLLLACSHTLSEADFRDSVLTLGFSIEQEAVLSKFYDSKKYDIQKLQRTGLNDSHYHDLQWRFEVQLSSRSLLQQVTPLITMDLTLKTNKDDSLEPEISHNLLQTDPTNLLHIANELENALLESTSRHSRKIYRALQINQDWGPNTITIKYFEPGHSFMKANSVHGQIGTQLKKQKEVLDFQDLLNLINKSSTQTVAIPLTYEDFKGFEDGCRQVSKKADSGINIIPVLGDVRIAEFRKNSKSLFYKTSFRQEFFLESSFLRKKFSLNLPLKLSGNRGINVAKKTKIEEVLCPYMPARKRVFWQELAINESSKDLCSISADE